MSGIVDLRAREILDSRGWPTVEVEAVLEGGGRGLARVPSGASTGRFEAHEKRDGDAARFRGRGVLKAVRAVHEDILPAVEGMEAAAQYVLDAAMVTLDGSPDKSRLGANALLAVSLAVADAAAGEAGLPLYRYLGGLQARVMPTPMMNLLNGGRHADNALDIQEFMVMPVGASSFREALRMGAETFHALRDVLDAKGLKCGLGDEGGLAPPLTSHEQALDTLMAAIEKAKFRPGEDIALALDAAASEFYEGGRYTLEGRKLASEDLLSRYEAWAARYPLLSLEDAMAEDDETGWRKATDALGGRLQLVGDDVFTTNPARIRDGVAKGFANAVLVKVNQIGTLSETLEALRLTASYGYGAIVSHRSGETEDSAIADLAVAVNCGQIKAGGLARSERLAKYNRLLRIEEELGEAALYAGAKNIACAERRMAAERGKG